MSDSSSSDDGNDCFKEAIDPTFFSNDLYRPTESKETAKEHVNLPPSRRNKNNVNTHFNPLEIRVTPEFRSYVSKHLHKLLDNNLDFTEELEVHSSRTLKARNEINGVKLLRTSSNILKDVQECHVPQKKYKKRRNFEDDSSSSSSIDEKRAKEVAVTADWILSGKATEGWAPCTRGELEIVVVKPSKK